MAASKRNKPCSSRIYHDFPVELKKAILVAIESHPSIFTLATIYLILLIIQIPLTSYATSFFDFRLRVNQTFKSSCNQIEPVRIIQNHLFILSSVNLITSTKSRSLCNNIFRISRNYSLITFGQGIIRPIKHSLKTIQSENNLFLSY